jgi:hypothetical protein
MTECLTIQKVRLLNLRLEAAFLLVLEEVYRNIRSLIHSRALAAKEANERKNLIVSYPDLWRPTETGVRRKKCPRRTSG